MIVKSSKSSIMIVVGLLSLMGISSLSVIPDTLQFPDKYSIRNHAHAFLETTFDLANSAEADLQGYGWGRRVKNLIDAGLFKGTYPAEMDEIRIDIKFKHWLTLNKDRDRALQKLILRDPQWVPAKIRYGGETIKTKIRLKGHMGEHRYMPNRWSLRLKLKKGATIKGLSQFSLLRPAARQFPADQLYQYWHQSIGGLSPDFHLVRVYVNGDYWGVLLMEEHVTKTMLALNNRREAPIFKLVSKAEEGGYFMEVNRGEENVPPYFNFQQEPVLYGAGKYSGNDRILRLHSYTLRYFRQLKRNAIDSQLLLDHEAFARSLVLTAAWGSGHTLNTNNSRFYLNPYTLLVEPINTDQTRYKRIQNSDNDNVYSGGIYGSPIKSILFENSLNQIMQNMKNSLPGLSDRHRELCTYFPLDCPSFHPDILRDNIKWVEDVAKPAWLSQGLEYRQNVEEIRPVDLSVPGSSNSNDPQDDLNVDYPEHVLAEHYDDGALRIYNLLSRPVNVTQIEIACTRRADSSCRSQKLVQGGVVLEGSTIASDLYFETWTTGVHDLGRGRNIEITTERNGKAIHTTVPFTLRTDIHNPLLLNREGFSDTIKPDWITLDGQIAYVQTGTWTVDAPVVLPIGVNMHISAGTTLNFSHNAYMIIRGALIAEGSETSPIILSPIEKSWKGLYVLQAGEKSSLSHVQIHGTDFLVDGVLDLTGGTTFYRSDVQISDSVFSGSLAEDALNIVHSNFDISNTEFSNNRSDAFDSDFSIGTIKASRFYDIDGDGVDTSGSTVDIQDITFQHIRDKAISVGEKSTMKASRIKVSDSGSAIVSKDGSGTVIDGLLVSGSQGYAAMAYVKKSVYGPASLTITHSNLSPSDVLNQTGNSMSVEGLKIPSENIDVDDLYASDQMKK